MSVSLAAGAEKAYGKKAGMLAKFYRITRAAETSYQEHLASPGAKSEETQSGMHAVPVAVCEKVQLEAPPSAGAESCTPISILIRLLAHESTVCVRARKYACMHTYRYVYVRV